MNENPYVSPVEISETLAEEDQRRKNRRTFYAATIILLILAVTTTGISMRYGRDVIFTKSRQLMREMDIRENRESRPEVIASVDVDVDQLRRNTMIWGIASFASFMLAIMSLIIAIRRGEKPHWMRVPITVLIIFYIMLQFVM